MSEITSQASFAASWFRRNYSPQRRIRHEYALPPLGLLTALSRRKIEGGMAEVLNMTDKRETELPGRRPIPLRMRLSQSAPSTAKIATRVGALRASRRS